MKNDKTYLLSRHKTDDIYHLYIVDYDDGTLKEISSDSGLSSSKQGKSLYINWKYDKWTFNILTEEEALLELI